WKTGGGGSSGSSDNAPSELTGTLAEKLLDAMEDEKDPATIIHTMKLINNIIIELVLYVSKLYLFLHYRIYRDSTRKEIEDICDLRERNQSKQSDADSTYCLCEKQYQENMIKRDLCKEY
ncbi:unnamed protein product, partial [Didymodactylos carnosus]